MGDHSAGMTLAAAICAALVARAAHRDRPAGQHLALPAGRLHRELRPEHLPDDRPADRGRAARDDGQPGDEQLRRRPTDGDSGSSGSKAIGTGPRCVAPSAARSGWTTPDSATPAPASSTAVELIAELDAIFATRSLDEWAEVFAGEPDFFWSPVNSLEDVVADEQFHAAGGIVDVPDGRIQHRDGGHTRGFPRHTVVAAFCGTGTRAAHRRNSRRTQGPSRLLTAPEQLYKFLQKCHAVR